MVVPFLGVGGWSKAGVSFASVVATALINKPLPDVAHDRPVPSRAVIVSADSPPLRMLSKLSAGAKSRR
jgi:hypothetical protein